MNDHNRYVDYTGSLRKQVFKLLDENPLLTPRQLSKQLEMTEKEYKFHRQTLTNYRSQWKYTHAKERGSRCSDYHCYKAFVVLKPEERPARDVALLGSWKLSKARNKFLVWRGRLGRVVWFMSGRVLLFVRKPGNLGKAKQLFCDAFVNSGLISDLKLSFSIVERIRPRSCHFPYETPVKLPRVEIRDFVDSHGILIKLGDRSHPNAVEVIAEFTSELEKMSDFMDGFKQFFESLNGGVQGQGKPLNGDDYAR